MMERFCENIKDKAVNNFRKDAPSQMFNIVLSTP